MRQHSRLAVGALVLIAAGGLATVPSSVAIASPVDPVTSYGSPGPQLCPITLPGGIKAVVSDQDGAESVEVVSRTAGGVLSFNSGGHQIVLPTAALKNIVASGAATGALDQYDTADLAERACGLATSAVSTIAAAAEAGNHQGGPTQGYQLGR